MTFIQYLCVCTIRFELARVCFQVVHRCVLRRHEQRVSTLQQRNAIIGFVVVHSWNARHSDYTRWGLYSFSLLCKVDVTILHPVQSTGHRQRKRLHNIVRLVIVIGVGFIKPCDIHDLGI